MSESLHSEPGDQAIRRQFDADRDEHGADASQLLTGERVAVPVDRVPAPDAP